jgi:hypothetical protein
LNEVAYDVFSRLDSSRGAFLTSGRSKPQQQSWWGFSLGKIKKNLG